MINKEIPNRYCIKEGSIFIVIKYLALKYPFILVNMNAQTNVIKFDFDIE